MVKQRFQALDVMRGLTLALMILVNTPGSWEFVYGPLLHADWNGATPTDFVFPFFMFIVGSAMYFSVRGLSQLTFAAQSKKILRRVGLLFLIGVLLAAYPFNESLDQWRVMGVLQRIALAYGFAAFIILYFGFTGRVVISSILLVGYWALLNMSDDPYSLEHNLVRQFDIAVLGASHLWQGKGMPFDPEGILSTFPSIVNVIIGFEATRILLASENKEKALSKLFVAALALIGVALVWHQVFPINKSLWTSPFVLLTCGVAILLLILLVKIEQSAIATAARPVYHFFEIIGKNPLFIYVLSGLLATTLYMIKIGSGSVYTELFGAFRSVVDPYLASLLFALLQVAILWFVAWVLHKRNIIISL
jgi:predicted acyltransferase